MLKIDPIEIYPNPATHFVAIDSIINVEKIEIFNFIGTLMIKEKNPDIIDIRGLSEGLYLIKIYTLMGVYSEQIIKKSVV